MRLTPTGSPTPASTMARKGKTGMRRTCAGCVWVGKRSAWGSWKRPLIAGGGRSSIYRRIGGLQAQGLTYDFIGLTYGSLGRYDLADDVLRRRLAISRDRKNLLGQVYGLNNVGTVLLRRGAIAEAKKTFDQALAIARRVRSLDGMGLSVSNLGWVAAGLGDDEAAIIAAARLGADSRSKGGGGARMSVPQVATAISCHRQLSRG